MVEIAPKGEFVLKTKSLVNYKEIAAGSKVFVNVCSSAQIDKSKDEIKSIEGVLKLIEEEDWVIPIKLSASRLVKIKDAKCLVFDGIINPIYINWCLVNEKFKTILGYWMCNLVEDKENGLFIDREEIKFPKRTSIDDPRVIYFKDEVNNKKETGKDQTEDIKTQEDNHIRKLEIRNNSKIEEVTTKLSNNSNDHVRNKIGDATNIIAKESKIVKTESPFTVTTIKLKDTETINNCGYLLKLKTKFKHDLIYNKPNNELVIKTSKLPPLHYKLPREYTIKKFSIFEERSKEEIQIYF